jgi:hypothetical protein
LVAFSTKLDLMPDLGYLALAFVWDGLTRPSVFLGVTLMKSYALAAFVAAAAVMPGTGFAEIGLEELYAREQTTLKKVPERRLNGFLNFLRKPGKQPGRSDAPNYSVKWLDAQPAAQGDENFACLAEALYFEARGETVKGQFAVAEVILNRVNSAQFPNSICGVVKQGTGRKYQCQFSYNCDGYKEVISERKAYERVAKVARAAIDGEATSLTDGATYYHTTAVRPRWSRVFTRTASIGVHLFYRDERYRTAASD